MTNITVINNQPWTPFVMTIVTGTDPEMADMDNPSGKVYGDAWFACYETKNGRRFLSKWFETLNDCLEDCAWRNQADIIPSGSDFETYSVYGVA